MWTSGTELATASVDRNSLRFSSQAVGTASPTQTVTLKNEGVIALAISSITVDAPFSETDNCTGSALNAGASCAVQVVFAPDRIGDVTGELAIFANVSGGRVSVALAGTGSLAGPISLSPGSLDFGQVAIGETSAVRTVTLENATSTAVPLTSISAAVPFRVLANPCGGTLAPSSACAVSVAFAPTQAGPASGKLNVVDGAGTQTVLLKGTGATAATDTLSASSMVFSSTPVGQNSSAQVVTLSNTGDLPLESISAVASTGFRSSDTCGSLLGAHAVCSISVVFAPTTVGSVDGTLTVRDANRSQTITLSGTAVAAPAFRVSSTQIAFDPISLGKGSSPVVLSITNSGGASMANVGFQISGPAASSFSWSQSTCGAILQSGSSCTVQLTFAPAQVGQLTATLVISTSTAGVFPVQVGLSGLGQGASKILISPAQLTFLQPRLGESTAAQFATITNSSDLIATELAVAASASFSVTQNTCGSSLGPGGTCSIGVNFTPNTNGLVRGTLNVSTRAFADPAIAALQGIGGAAGSVQIQPGSLVFPSTGVGATSSAQLVTLTNDGPIAISDLALSASAGFKISSSTCGTTLDVSSSCTAQIAFSPVSAGQQTGKLTAMSSMLAAPAQIAVSGMGFDFLIGTTGPTSKTVSSGQTATYTLTLAPLNGSAGNFTYTCSSLPANAACSFNPASASVPANATWSVTLNISTGLSHSSASLSAPGRSTSSLIPFACLIVLPIAFGFRRRGVWMMMLMAALFGIASCAGAGGGGGGTPPSTNQNTAAGSYSVVVTASANGVSHNTTLSLVVD